ncbi:DUF1129 domain-containing protein [Enterococcus dispar]|jgi:uncharacterized membrane-anchored protein|uniref:Integral membrane protein n=1 Tax=Enterococcus dispar ATCC 51266 TaxID=1139219 RepID=S1P003_9ENTE|nr:DUF1129 domain-containing protein [Enterococcus dispar]EOT39834.1 hypothetical protein OMK_02171 [Enterococcus dispar ATCC 51266]EOW86399.1 hypothetical protein I569_01734 [Enterococcus dispar ATCC 51266]MCU7357324.1 DUF1129 domain-containing protein [Enterococcus dispar]MDT2706098.1 DUF1129 domain-containing protein [Enterococcus dispar]OJG38181.1 hypothetical protein RV01_GL000434 [Enterococcus dispar]
MDAEALRAMVAENRALEPQLTKRNQQYIFDLKKSLEAANLSEAEMATALNEILPILVKEQKGGKTARQLFGTVSERTEAILAKPEPKKETRPVLMWADNVMFIFGLFAVMLGLMRLFTKDTGQQTYGLLTLIIASLFGGYAFYLMYKYIYQYERPGADKSKRPKLWKTMLILVPVFFLWILVFTVSAMLPFNIVLDPFIQLVLGAAVFALRWYLKKKYNIEGSLTIPKN